MKIQLLLVFIGGLLNGCADSYGDTHNEPKDKMENKLSVSQAVSSALESNDLRLYATTGRRPVIPGLESMDFTALKAQCGIKYLSGTGDVIKSEQDKRTHLQRYEFAKAYNLEIYARCKKSS
ncbi:MULTISPECIES: hypothetical protein [Pseudoalteromonas]|uniref:Lipoprotein n=1 Tax=Pseudoalteromonas obscura TaxID=3048491 RepID=A0ABT7EM83_9GAMM|nr:MULTISPECIES: hypothetical protein [Pseudoalteromonas]MBQ4837894.1 hypothetical protein [Pseudoalteromonas luteoviolacea]MDK2596160.1 hypothetical protein [Pseudoalteromonas sp. P94(2023)]